MGPGMTERGRETLRRIGARARRGFSHAHMSDTKWRKLLCALDEAGFERAQIIVQSIDRPEPRVVTLAPRTALARWPGRDGHPVPTVPQDVAPARAVPEAPGRLPLEETGRDLRTLGYGERWSET